ncbi:MAG: helix-turn-helix transcriptional regulator [Clostridia bacterium]|nr:helix-turn-helix transcriptional regulator [Clostridia bacterium]
MAEKGFTQADLSRALHVSENSISKKLNGKSYFSAEETCKIASLLGIGVSEIGVYFFTT